MNKDNLPKLTARILSGPLLPFRLLPGLGFLLVLLSLTPVQGQVDPLTRFGLRNQALVRETHLVCAAVINYYNQHRTVGVWRDTYIDSYFKEYDFKGQRGGISFWDSTHRKLRQDPEWRQFFDDIDTTNMFTIRLSKRLLRKHTDRRLIFYTFKRTFFNVLRAYLRRNNPWYVRTYQYHSSGPLLFSPVIFSKDHTKAVCYTMSYKGKASGGSGKVYFLEKKEGKWHLIKGVLLWIS